MLDGSLGCILGIGDGDNIPVGAEMFTKDRVIWFTDLASLLLQTQFPSLRSVTRLKCSR